MFDAQHETPDYWHSRFHAGAMAGQVAGHNTSREGDNLRPILSHATSPKVGSKSWTSKKRQTKSKRAEMARNNADLHSKHTRLTPHGI